MVTIIILYVLGAIMLAQIAGIDTVRANGAINKALRKWERVTAGIFWPIIAAGVAVNGVKKWIIAKRNKA